MYIQKTFSFKTKKRKSKSKLPQFEDVFLSSIPSSFDITINDSIINVITQSVDNYTKSLNDVVTTLDRITKSLQIASCNIKDLINNLKNYQNIAEDFARNNNNTKIYYRQVGLDGDFIYNKESFLKKIKESIMIDTGADKGKLPLITPVSIYADADLIYHALIDDDTNIISKLYGAGKLSNHYQLLDGFYVNEINIKNTNIIINNNRIYITINYINNYKTLIGSKIEIKNTNIDNIYIISDVNIDKNKNIIISVNYKSQVNYTMIGDVIIYHGDKISTKIKLENIFKNYDKTKKIPVTTVVDILIKNNIICNNIEVYDNDKKIALDRLSRYSNQEVEYIGGILFIGAEKDINNLINKLDMLADIFKPLKYTSENLKSKVVLGNLQKSKSLTNIEYENKYKFNKFKKENNVGILEAIKALDDVKNSNVLNWNMPILEKFDNNENDYDYSKWRYFSLVELIPQLEVLNKVENNFNKIGIGYSMAISSIGDLIAYGQNSLNDLVQSVESNILAIENIIDKLNQAYEEIENYLDKYRRRINYKASSLKVAIIGRDKNLMSNYDFYVECERYINNKKDFNNPFNNKDYNIYYGIIFFIIGRSEKELYSKIDFLKGILSIE